MLPLQLAISNRYKRLANPVAETHKVFRALQACGVFPISAGELSVAFVTDTLIRQVHQDFMGIPTVTDVITFPADVAMGSAGEIIVSVDQARSRADEWSVSFSHELSLYLVHGWLHLAGYDDRTRADQLAMRRAEEQAFGVLDQACAGNHFQLNGAD